MKCCNAKMYFSTDNKATYPEDITATNNIALISYSVLLNNKGYYYNSPPVCCYRCGSALSMYSILYLREDYYTKIEKQDLKPSNHNGKVVEETKVEEISFVDREFIQDLRKDEASWICEFCGQHNRISVKVKVPQTEDELYILDKIEDSSKYCEETENEPTNLTNKDDTNIIFCIDVSGSMGDFHRLHNGGGVDIPRMKLVADGVLRQIGQIKIENPSVKIGIVTFDSKVTLYGDCSGPSIPVNVDLNDFDKLLHFSKDNACLILNKSVNESFQKISATISQLKPGSATALGPGLLCSLGLAQGKPGSRIILCTDGLANIGLGNLKGGEVSEASRAFYEKVIDIASESGISISIITIKGNACRADTLGLITDRTGGIIVRVDPADMDLSNITSNSLIATNVKLKVIIHKGFEFVNEDSRDITNNGSVLSKKVGSVSKYSEVYFEYRLKKAEELKEEGIRLDNTKLLPLQCQIFYTDLKGKQFVRIFSQQQELTQDKNEAEKEIEATIFGNYIEKESASLALEGKIKEAKDQNERWSKFLDKVVSNPQVPEDKKLQSLIEQVEMPNCNMDITKSDDITSQLYQLKQQKRI